MPSQVLENKIYTIIIISIKGFNMSTHWKVMLKYSHLKNKYLTYILLNKLIIYTSFAKHFGRATDGFSCKMQVL